MEVQELLTSGRLKEAKARGWTGTAALHRAVADGVGTRAFSFKLGCRKGKELGFDLTNETGVAMVRSIQPSGVASATGLQSGDIITRVNGGPLLFTCEAVVRALRVARDAGEEVVLSVARPNASGSSSATPPGALARWQESALVVGAGAQHHFSFRITDPAVLQFRFAVSSHDVGFKVGAVSEDDGQGRVFGRGLLLHMRSCGEQGSVPLHHVGAYSVVIDNSFSYLRGKTVSYSISLHSERHFEEVTRRERRAQLQAEVERRKSRSAELAKQGEDMAPRLQRLREKMAQAEAKLTACNAEKRENDLLLTEALAKLKVLIS